MILDSFVGWQNQRTTIFRTNWVRLLAEEKLMSSVGVRVACENDRSDLRRVNPAVRPSVRYRSVSVEFAAEPPRTVMISVGHDAAGGGVSVGVCAGRRRRRERRPTTRCSAAAA